MIATALKYNQDFKIGKRRDRDPTLTLTLRRRFAADLTRRFKALIKVVKTSVDTNDCFGLRKKKNPFSIVVQENLEALPVNAFEYEYSDSKVNGFMRWLRNQEDKGILEISTDASDVLGDSSKPWTNTYIQTSYQKGIKQARHDLRKEGVDIPSYTSEEALSAAFNSSFHADRAALLYTRTYSQLQGITAAMDQQISRVLTTGLMNGLSPYQIAYDITDRINKIGITRARRLARTEITNAHGQAYLNELDNASDFLGEDIKVRWWTARDEKVRDRHRARHNKIYDRTKARAMLGEPNCRCGLIAVIVEEKKTKKKATKKKTKKKTTKKKSTIKDVASTTVTGVIDSGELLSEKWGTNFYAEDRKSRSWKSDDSSQTLLSQRIQETDEVWQDIEDRFQPTTQKNFKEVIERRVNKYAITPYNNACYYDTYYNKWEYPLGFHDPSRFEINVAGRLDNGEVKVIELGSTVENFNWSVSGSTFKGVVRHETGHAFHRTLSMQDVSDWEDMFTTNNRWIKDGKYQVTKYATWNEREAFAESFAAWTSPYYEAGSLPNEIEDFFNKILPKKKGAK